VSRPAVRRLVPVAALILLAACSDIGGPLRTDNFYEWRVVQATDTLSFHWPQSFLPVRIWAEDQVSLPLYADSSIAKWKRVFLFGEWNAVRVTDSATADVIIRYGPPPAGDDILLDRVALESFAPECQATTLPHIDDRREAHLPMHVYISARFVPELPETQACLALTLTHEIGHTLGIFRHSPHPEDLMYSNPTVAAPSERDRNTAEILYHSPANVSPAPRP
jgi:predicted Zn-dependent protease